MTKEAMYDYLVECVCSEDFVSGAIAIGGYNTDTLQYVLYYHTGYSDFESYMEDMQ